MSHKIFIAWICVAVAAIIIMFWFGAMSWAMLGCGAHDRVGELCRDRVERIFMLPGMFNRS